MNKDEATLRQILTLVSMNKKRLCEELEKWLNSVGLLYEEA
jgi:hypothetical protein